MKEKLLKTPILEEKISIPATIGQLFWYVLWQADRPLRWQFIAKAVVAVIGASLVMLKSYQLKVILDSFVAAQAKENISCQDFVIPVVIYISCLVFAKLIIVLRGWIRIFSVPGYYRVILRSFLNHTLGHSSHFFQSNLSGAVSSKLFSLVNSFHQISNLCFTSFISLAINFVYIFIFMILIHPTMGIFFILWFLFFIGFVVPKLAKRLYDKASDYSAANANISGFVTDVLGNNDVVRSFGRQQEEMALFSVHQDSTIDKQVDLQKYALKAFSIQNFTLLVSEVIVLLLLVYGFKQQWVSAGDFVLIVTILINFLNQAGQLVRQLADMIEQFGNCRDAIETLSQPHEITDLAQAEDLEVKTGSIEFENVNFHYPSGYRVFENLSVKIEPGQKVGLVGFSGAGKTTFTRLILRQFEIQQGKILIDNQPINEITQDSLRAQIALIPQDPSLFQRSLMENIRYGRLDATDEEVMEAAQKACCHEFIAEMPEGYQTLVGERGIKLSGGQRQRIAIARAMLRNVPILILDEATSSLDSITEQTIQRDLKKIIQGKTAIVIAHRLSTLSFMDRIIVFQEGKIVEDGSSNELLSKNGHFAYLYKSQSNGLLPREEKPLLNLSQEEQPCLADA
ncbi:MAG: ABC transporter ATP-binding protein [Hormoscilla sp. GUM202]|nr:ABC transporter ATP-binding protein [Hormoscilla sp. GUM202]